MHRLARTVPVVVALFVVFLVTLLVARSRTAPVVSAPPGGPARADLSIKEVAIEEQSGSVRWQLKAEQALVYDRDRRTSLRNIAVVVHDRDKSWTIRADEGDVWEREATRRDVEVRRNVVVTSYDGSRLETSVLRWDSGGRRLWTRAPVRLVRSGGVVNGTGFELTTDNETVTVSRVRATFKGGSSKGGSSR